VVTSWNKTGGDVDASGYAETAKRGGNIEGYYRCWVVFGDFPSWNRRSRRGSRGIGVEKEIHGIGVVQG